MATTRQTSSDLLTLKHSEYNAQLFKTSLFSDCTIYSNHRVWHLHRCILSPRSEFFWKCFQGDFEEASSSRVEMHDDNPDTLGRLLLWLYTLEFPQAQSSTQGRIAWSGNLDLYMMAEKYGLADLMEATKQALLKDATKSIDQPENFLISAEDYVDAMQTLYEDLPEREDIVSLRSELLRITAQVLAKQMRHSEALQELMANIPAFGVALIESLAQQKLDRRFSNSSSASLESNSACSKSTSRSISPQYVKPYIPLNEDSEDEMS